jgi:oligopeptide/dipeptide ABC transporter ATP-binding protein
MSDAALLEIEHLTKHFPYGQGLVFARVSGLVRAVDDVSFSVQRGETLALVGESGCGKTTIARLILRLEVPTSGEVRFEGANVHQLSGAALRSYRMKVQAVFQDPFSSLNPRMRVRDIVAEALVVNRHVSRGEVTDRVNELLAEVGLRADQARLFPHEFSGGQRQRIALASALVAGPEIVVLDEPVSALDVSIQAQIMNLLKHLQETHQISYLLVSHNLASVRYLADSVVVMYLGEVVERAPTELLYEHQLHPYTRALFSAALPARLDVQREEIVLEGEIPSPLNPPSGCRFRLRCPWAMKVCAEVRPQRLDAEPGHMVACHLFDPAIVGAANAARLKPGS